jgi:KDO2-lipid IV(A) lauroyltransferase
MPLKMPSAYSIGWSFAAMLWPFFKKRRRLSVDNILKAKITTDKKEAQLIAKRSWCHLAGHIAEALRVPYVVNKGNWREHLDFEDADEEVVRLLLEETDTPILLVSSHHGVWEAATNVISLVRPMIAIARTMNNRFVASWMKRHFRGRVTVIDKNNGFTPEILRQWKSDCAAMTILMDQHTQKGADLTFMGRKAKTFTSAARLAMRTGYPIVVGSFVRVGPYKYRLVGGKPLRFDKVSDRDENVQMLNDRLEDAIRKYPDQYLWAHRRWRCD